MSHNVFGTALALISIVVLAHSSTAQDQSRSDSHSTQSKANPKMDDISKPSGEASDEKPQVQFATFGGGCFWCVEAVFERVPGVRAAVSGYAGGTFPRPTYELVCSGETGHAEVVQIEYDPTLVTYEQLLRVFFSSHDPTTLNRQGPDAGTQYRSIILTHDEEQAKTATKFIQKLNAENVFGAPVVTEVVPAGKFFIAEKYHQDYYKKNPNKPYCQMMIAPKLKKLGLK